MLPPGHAYHGTGLPGGLGVRPQRPSDSSAPWLCWAQPMQQQSDWSLCLQLSQADSSTVLGSRWLLWPPPPVFLSMALGGPLCCGYTTVAGCRKHPFTPRWTTMAPQLLHSVYLQSVLHEHHQGSQSVPFAVAAQVSSKPTWTTTGAAKGHCARMWGVPSPFWPPGSLIWSLWWEGQLQRSLKWLQSHSPIDVMNST